VVVEGLRESHREAKVEETEQAAHLTEARVRLVLGAGRGVLTAREPGVGFVGFAEARTHRPDQDEKHELRADRPGEDFGRRCRRGRQDLDERLHEERKRRHLLAERDPADDVIQDDPDRPREQQQGGDAQDQEQRLEREFPPERADEAERARDHAKGLGLADPRALLKRRAHDGSPAADTRAIPVSASTRLR
jgi:hypothetical protein